MKVPLRWLEEFIELPTRDPDELSTVLAMIGHEVEGYETLTADWSDVVVGEVVEISPHPDADKIRVCRVDIGAGPTQIICGAWNFEIGALVPVAIPGAVLPGSFEIGKRSIRGVESNGMICSERELGLGEDHEGILVLDGSPALGRPFAELLELPDVVLDVTITPNRPDAMSLLGLARDLAAHYEITYRIPDRPLQTVEGKTSISVQIEDNEGCRRFVAREVGGVEVRRSPLRVRHRLRKSGIRAISNVVDVTNYVMLELGHPLHAFDADSIVGDKLSIRRATDGERLVTLDDQERTLSSDDLIIYDEEGPISMSGTMGGARSEVGEDTTRVLMEAASWDPPTIMFMSRRHDLRSEASTRFERGVDPNLADVANSRATAMVAELSGGSVLEGQVDEIAGDLSPVEVDLPMAEIERLLGPGLDVHRVGGILERLGMTISGSDPVHVVVPTYRPDVTRPIDLVEEIARIHGYDNFPSTLPTGPAGGLTPEQRRERELRRILAGLGLSQAVTLPFVGAPEVGALGMDTNGLVEVKNPLRDEERRLRPSLLPNLLRAIAFNASHSNSDVAFYEMGSVFLNESADFDSRLPAQPNLIAWAIVGRFGPRNFGRRVLEADANLSMALVRAIAERMNVEATVRAASAPGFHPGRSAEILVDGKVIGHAGELHPAAARHHEIKGRIAIAELEVDPLVAIARHPAANSPSVFPNVDFDLSFVIGEDLPVADLVAATSAAAGDLLESVQVFDEYRGEDLEEGTRAVALRYRLRAADRTLTNEEVAPVRTAMIERATSIGSRLRGTE